MANGGYARPCPQCGQPARWYKVKGLRRYVTGCCDKRSFSPLATTMFAHSNLPLRKWFRALLYMTNSDAGLPTAFFSAQLGISTKAAWRMANRIRQHLQILDWSELLGQNGGTVFVGETALGQVVNQGGSAASKVRLLVIGDRVSIRFLPLPAGRFRNIRATLERAIAPDAEIVLRSWSTAVKLHGYRRLYAERAARYRVIDDPWMAPFGELEAAAVRMKRVLLHAHLRIDYQYLPSYLGHFSFLLNRRKDRRSAFDTAIASFPPLPQLGGTGIGHLTWS